jgi:hypothetical protein
MLSSRTIIWQGELVMRRFVFISLASGLVLAGCAPSVAPPKPPAAQPVSTPASTKATAPPAPEPTASGPCPYLKTDFVAQSNGQRVSKVQTSADQLQPSCFFYALDGKPQLTVRVYVGESAVATALVDEVAPLDSSSPATEPAGWSGGYEVTGTGAVYAVSKQGAAVVVTTNQKQSVKARTVAKQAIAGLKL